VRERICVQLGMPWNAFSHHRHSADLFSHYKTKLIFYTCLIFSCFFKNCNYMLISVKVLSHYCVWEKRMSSVNHACIRPHAYSQHTRKFFNHAYLAVYTCVCHRCLTYPSVCQRMIEIFHTLVRYAIVWQGHYGKFCTNKPAGSSMDWGMVPRFLNRHLTI
jgi:hypothetical protein